MAETIAFEGCKHLSYDIEKYDKRLILKALPFGIGVYWERPGVLCNGENKHVQFCQLRGRLNSKIACLKNAGFECSEGELVEHKVTIGAINIHRW